MVELEHELYKAREVAAMLRLNTKTLYGWVKKGKVNVIRTPSGGIRVPRLEVMRLVAVYGDVADAEGVDKQVPHE
jgi:predicted site-specific integrase-resolvase